MVNTKLLSIIFALVALHVFLMHSQAIAQNNSLHKRQSTNGSGYTPPLTMAQANIIRSMPVEPRRISVNDIIQIRVNELARMTFEGEQQRRKNALINATLFDWVRLNGFSKLEAVGEEGNDPTIQAQLQHLNRAEGEIETTERLTFNIAARVADVRPNGNLILEAHKEVKVNQEVFRVALTGVCRQEDIAADGVILSSSIVDLKILKKDQGTARDSYKRGWLQRAFDRINPF